MPTLRRPLFVYDGGCRFCRASARFIASLDRAQRFSFLPMHDERAAELVTLVPEVDRFQSFHIIQPDGATYSRGGAVLLTLTTLRWTSAIGRVLGWLRARWALDMVYRVVASNRGRLARWVRDAPGPDRWP